MKRCFRCKREKPLDAFGNSGVISKSNPGGKHSYCRECMTQYNREREAKKREKEQREARWVE